MDMVIGYSGMDESMAYFNVRKKEEQTSLTKLRRRAYGRVRED